MFRKPVKVTEIEIEGQVYSARYYDPFVAQPKNELTKKVRKDRLLTLVDGLLTEAVHLGFTAEDMLAMISERVAKFQFPAGWDKAAAAAVPPTSRRSSW